MELWTVDFSGVSSEILTNGSHYLVSKENCFKILDKWDNFVLVETLPFIEYSEFGWTPCL